MWGRRKEHSEYTHKKTVSALQQSRKYLQKLDMPASQWIVSDSHLKEFLGIIYIQPTEFWNFLTFNSKTSEEYTLREYTFGRYAFGKYTFGKYTFRKYTFVKYTFWKLTFWRFFLISKVIFGPAMLYLDQQGYIQISKVIFGSARLYLTWVLGRC